MYSARITRKSPTALIFLIDQSGSMEETTTFGDQTVTKAEAVSIVTNNLLREIINRCRREDGIRNYFDVAAIGYCSDEVNYLLGTKDSFTTPSALSVADCRMRSVTRERRIPGGDTVLMSEQIRYWIEPRAEGNTPMKGALEQALLITSQWCRSSRNRDSYPPTIFNITDGEATDGDAEEICSLARQIRSLGTNDGDTLLININISSSCGETILFPSSESELPAGRYARMLYRMSSEMPVEYNGLVAGIKSGGEPPYRAMSLNTSVTDLISMMNIGSRSINKLL